MSFLGTVAVVLGKGGGGLEPRTGGPLGPRAGGALGPPIEGGGGRAGPRWPEVVVGPGGFGGALPVVPRPVVVP